MKTEMIFFPEKNAPLVHLELALVNGSLRDPDGKEGVASLALSMLLRGTQRSPAARFHERLDALGAEISLGKYKESMRIHGLVLAEKLPAFLDLLEEMLTEPSFHEDEFKKLREQLRSSFMDELGADDEIADRRFQEYMLWGNVYGKMTSGSLQTLDQIHVSDLRAFHGKYFRSGDFVVGASGGFDRKFLEKRLRDMLGKLPGGAEGRMEAEGPTLRRGRGLLLLDKPDRTQAQILVGAPGISFDDKDYFSMLVANHVFGGGSFSARLMKEVREKRGWSYGAYSWYRSGRRPLYFAMQSVPSNKDAVPALELMTKLFRAYGAKGVTKDEYNFAKSSLVNQSAFLQDTARKRLDNKVTEAVLGLPKGFYDGYQKKLMSLTHARVQAAIRRHVDPSRMFAVMLGSADELMKGLGDLKGYPKVWRRKFDEPAVSLDSLTPLILAPRPGARKAVSKKRKR